VYIEQCIRVNQSLRLMVMAVVVAAATYAVRATLFTCFGWMLVLTFAFRMSERDPHIKERCKAAIVNRDSDRLPREWLAYRVCFLVAEPGRSGKGIGEPCGTYDLFGND
jgi:hypothetical protein